jgi:hypothetical protein
MSLEIIESIVNYHNAFLFLKDRKYKEGWNELVKAEINIQNIICNISRYKDYQIVPFLDEYIRKYQSIYPYKIFMSMAGIIKKSECSICGKSMDPFSGCSHRKGKVYLGELCYETVIEMNVLRFDAVTNPSMKTCVMFEDIENPNKYQLLEFLVPQLTDEYMTWSYNVIQKYEPHTKYKIGRNDLCPCLSGRKYKKCCMHNPEGIKYDHYEFRLSNK